MFYNPRSYENFELQVTVTYSDALFVLFRWHVFDFDLLKQVIHRVTQHQIIRTTQFRSAAQLMKFKSGPGALAR
jgi:hypothetical protein